MKGGRKTRALICVLANKDVIKKLGLKVWPYVAAIIAGFVFLPLGILFSEDLKSLFINIAAAFFAIPLLFLIYDLSRKFTHKRLNQEIFDYAKMQIDREMLSIISQIMKMVYPYKKGNFTHQSIRDFLSITEGQIKNLITTYEYIGFQVLKGWEVTEQNLERILQNAFMVDRLEDEQIISVIVVLKSVRGFEQVQKISNLFNETEKESHEYKIVSAREFSERNIQYLDRYLLLRIIDEKSGEVVDFGDFLPMQIKKALKLYKVDKNFTQVYAEVLINIIKAVNQWIKETGNEFIIDPKMFRFAKDK